jgi:hypothetical protein
MRKALVAAGWAWAAAIVWLSLTPAPPRVELAYGDKLGHLAAYGLLMFWFARLYRGRPAQLAYALGFCAMGVALELAQGALGTRSLEALDMAANALGVALGWGLASGLQSRV